MTTAALRRRTRSRCGPSHRSRSWCGCRPWSRRGCSRTRCRCRHRTSLRRRTWLLLWRGPVEVLRSLLRLLRRRPWLRRWTIDVLRPLLRLLRNRPRLRLLCDRLIRTVKVLRRTLLFRPRLIRSLLRLLRSRTNPARLLRHRSCLLRCHRLRTILLKPRTLSRLLLSRSTRTSWLLRLSWLNARTLRLTRLALLEARPSLIARTTRPLLRHACRRDRLRMRISRDRTRCRKRCRTSLVHIRKLSAILLRIVLRTQLCRHRRHTRLTHRIQLCRNRPLAHAARSTVVADAPRSHVHRMLVHVNIRDVDVVHGAVVLEAIAAPVTALIPAATVSKTVVNPAVVTDIPAPVSAEEEVMPTAITPVSRRPERTLIRRHRPSTRHPVIAHRSPRPVARRPEISIARQRRLHVIRQLRWRLVALRLGIVIVHIAIVESGIALIYILIPGLLIVGRGRLRRRDRLIRSLACRSLLLIIRSISRAVARSHIGRGRIRPQIISLVLCGHTLVAPGRNHGCNQSGDQYICANPVHVSILVLELYLKPGFLPAVSPVFQMQKNPVGAKVYRCSGTLAFA